MLEAKFSPRSRPDSTVLPSSRRQPDFGWTKPKDLPLRVSKSEHVGRIAGSGMTVILETGPPGSKPGVQCWLPPTPASASNNSGLLQWSKKECLCAVPACRPEKRLSIRESAYCGACRPNFVLCRVLFPSATIFGRLLIACFSSFAVLKGSSRVHTFGSWRA
jgi:hypothetical protein